MKSKNLSLVLFFIISQVSYSQTHTKTGFSDNENKTYFLLPDTEEMFFYYDSLTTQLKKTLLTGYTFSVYNEIIPRQTIKYSFNNKSFHETTSDRRGRFFVIPKDLNFNQIHLIYSNNKEYHSIDTIIEIIPGVFQPLILNLQPRYKIILRGRSFTRRLPLEDVKVQIIHRSDTFNTKTLTCFTDEEDYWNCLYRGMFKQEILFDDPSDTLKITLSKKGFSNNTVWFKCADYNGTILPIKMHYSRLLPELYAHHIILKVGPPIANNWMVTLNYNHLFRFKRLSRLSTGLGAGMFLKDRATDLRVSPNQQNILDSASINTHFDSTYVSAFIGPNVQFWITNPQKRVYSFYTGLSTPFIFSQKKFYLQPFLGGRFYLDLNKAFIVEARYLNYELQVLDYFLNQFNSVASNTINISVDKLYFNMGFQVSF